MNTRLHSERADVQLLDGLTAAAELPADAGRQHSWRVAQIAGRLALGLGLAAADADRVSGAARFHDVGKIAISAVLIAKPGPLSAEERRTMQSHSVIGAQILSGGRSPLLQLAAQIALTHHERWDGHGYPCRLRGSDIPLAGRIVAVADTWDALTNDRPYRTARSGAEALYEVLTHAGTQFDPDVVRALVNIRQADQQARPDRPVPGHQPTGIHSRA